MTCCHCQCAEDIFAGKTAKRELRRYRRRGPRKSTRLLLNMLRAADLRDRTLLDVGGGIGVIQHELLPGGLSSAVHVDASSAYLEVSEAEAARRGHRDRVTYYHGDAVELAPELPAADLVTLDRVVCCYPDMDRLVDATAQKAGRVYGLVFPRVRWETRVGVRAANLILRLRGSDFRVYLHPEGAVDAAVRRNGLRQTGSARTFLWNVVTYQRDPAT